MGFPKVCFCTWVPVREKESQREQCLLDEIRGQDFGIARRMFVRNLQCLKNPSQIRTSSFGLEGRDPKDTHSIFS